MGHISSLKNAILLAFGDADEDYQYFSELEEQGYEYITIDCNNRDHCILDYMNDVFLSLRDHMNLGLDSRQQKTISSIVN